MSLQKLINEKHIFLFEKRARGICPQSRLILIKSVNVHMLTFLKNRVLNLKCALDPELKQSNMFLIKIV